MRLVAAIAVLIASLVPVASFAQQSSPPGPYVLDLRGVMSGVPQGAAFFAVSPPGTIIPRRGFGLGIGMHVYPLRLGAARVGIGVDGMRMRGTAATPVATSSSSTSSAAKSAADAAMDMTAVAGQLSFNFGTRDGWSFLTLGYGTTRTRSQVSRDVLGPIEHSVAIIKLHTPTINYGGGARWFIRQHIAVGFDVRFHRLSSVNGQPGARVFALSAGLSVR